MAGTPLSDQAPFYLSILLHITPFFLCSCSSQAYALNPRNYCAIEYLSPFGISFFFWAKHSSSAFFASLIPNYFLDLSQFVRKLSLPPLKMALGIPLICICSTLCLGPDQHTYAYQNKE